jgi:hypothetical protein
MTKWYCVVDDSDQVWEMEALTPGLAAKKAVLEEVDLGCGNYFHDEQFPVIVWREENGSVVDPLVVSIKVETRYCPVDIDRWHETAETDPAAFRRNLGVDADHG